MNITAESMRELVSQYEEPHEHISNEKMIEFMIRLRAKNGHNNITFDDMTSKSKFNFISANKKMYEDSGFTVSFDSDYGFTEVTISWED